LIASGVQFDEARTVEPLTSPGVTSMITSLYPHEHGATRNGVPMRGGLPSFTKILSRRGYVSAAFVGNWTLNDKISGLAEHFNVYKPVLKRKRWVIFGGEARADDINEAALDWLEEQRAADPQQRVFLWVHYVEPHGPYHYHEEYARQLGIGTQAAGKKLRYDSEIAFVDERIGEFLARVDELLGGEERLTVFTSDHGESLGEHGYWGHGRHVYEPGLRIPLAIAWPDRIKPGVIDESALNIDIPQTILGMLDLPIRDTFQGFDWTPVLLGREAPPAERATVYQAHKGAAQSDDLDRLRQRGLLEVARISGGRKEILRVPKGRIRLYDRAGDPSERQPKEEPGLQISADLSDWLGVVQEGLRRSDELPPPSLTSEDMERLKALGYID
jgi:arylsulfatase A-like enzyme